MSALPIRPLDMTNLQGAGAAMKKSAESEHLQRVTAWCEEIAARLALPTPDRNLLEKVVPLHQRTKLVTGEEAWNRLRHELSVAEGELGPTFQSNEALEILRALHGDRSGNERFRRLAMIVEQCDDLDAACELDAISPEPELSGLDDIVAEVGTYFAGASDEDVNQAADRLPVFSAVANRAIVLLANDETNLNDVESIVSQDQTLAGHLIRAANSALAGAGAPVNTIHQAVARIGLGLARRIVSAAALRQLFDGRQSRALWNHSLDVAEHAARIAQQCQLLGREEGFLAGLVHDIGKLVILNLPSPELACQERLIRKGCPVPTVERVVLKQSHADAGARLVRKWCFSEAMVEGVENHHQPETNASLLSCILYLAELKTGEVRDEESDWRRQLAIETLDLNDSPEVLPESGGPLAELRFAAGA